MPKCPKCNEEIEHLVSFLKGEQKDYFKADENAEPEYEWKDFITDYENIDFECPECKDVLFTNEEEALKFLIKGTQKAVVKIAREL